MTHRIERAMRRRITALFGACVVGLVTFLAWPRTHDAKYYFDRAWDRLPGDEDGPGDPHGAIADFNRAIKLNPGFAAAYAGRAIAKTAITDPADRVSFFRPREGEHESPGKSARRDEAIADLNRAIELDPKQSDYFDRRAWLKYQQGDLSGMIADLARAREVTPSAQIPLPHIGSSAAETSQKLLRGGLRNYDRALAQNPAFPSGYYHRGVLKYLANDLDGALADFRRCSEFSDSKLSDYAAIHIWLVRAQKNETVGANQELSDHFSARPNGTSPDWEKQIAEFLLDRISETEFRAAASGSETESRRSQFWCYKGLKLLLAGDQAKAAECFRQALTTEERPYAVLMSAEIQLGRLKQ